MLDLLDGFFRSSVTFDNQHGDNAINSANEQPQHITAEGANTSASTALSATRARGKVSGNQGIDTKSPKQANSRCLLAEYACSSSLMALECKD